MSVALLTASIESRTSVERFVSFLSIRSQWPSVTRVTTLVGFLWVGAALAEPLGRESRPGAPVVPIDDDVGSTTTDEMGEYMEQLERHLDWMHRRAEWRKDADTVAAVEAIQKKLAVAKDHHRKLCRLCADELHDTVLARECCQTVDDVMHEVIEDHLALMRRLRGRRSGQSRIRRIEADTEPMPSLPRGQLARGS